MYDEVDDLDPDSIEVVTIRLNDIQLVLVHNMLGLPLFNVTLNATNLDIKKEQGKMEGEHSSEGAAREWSTVVDSSITPPSFTLVSLPLSRSPLL